MLVKIASTWFFVFKTCQYMKPNCSSFEDGGFAGVVSGVGRTGIPGELTFVNCEQVFLSDPGVLVQSMCK